MKSELIENLKLPYLARLLTPDFLDRPWSDADGLAALFQQLNAPVEHDLKSCPDVPFVEISEVLRQDVRPSSFLDELVRPVPRINVLIGIKSFAKLAIGDKNNPLFGTPGSILYYAAIASAQRSGGRISHLSDLELARAFNWALAQEGAKPLRELFACALEDLPLTEETPPAGQGMGVGAVGTNSVDQLVVVRHPNAIEILYYCPICEASNELKHFTDLSLERCHECHSPVDVSKAELSVIHSSHGGEGDS